MTNKKGRGKGRGWHNHPLKHALASKGIKTKMSSKGRNDEMLREEEEKIFNAFYHNDKFQEIVHDFYEGDIHPDIEWYINHNYDIFGEMVDEDGEIEFVPVKIGTPRYGNSVFVEWEQFRNVTSKKSYEMDVREEIFPAYSEPAVDFVDDWLEDEGYYNEKTLNKLSDDFVESKADDFELWMRNVLMKQYAEDYIYTLKENEFDVVPKYEDEPEVYDG